MHPYILTWPWKRLLWLNSRENRQVAAVNRMTLHKTTKCGKWSLLHVVLGVATSFSSCCKHAWLWFLHVNLAIVQHVHVYALIMYTCVQLLTPCTVPAVKPLFLSTPVPNSYTHTRTCLTSSTSLAFLASAGVAYSGSILARVDTFCVRTTLWS